MLCFNTAVTLQLSQHTKLVFQNWAGTCWSARWLNGATLRGWTANRPAETGCMAAVDRAKPSHDAVDMPCTEAIWLCWCRFNKLICLCCTSAVLSIPSNALAIVSEGRVSVCFLTHITFLPFSLKSLFQARQQEYFSKKHQVDQNNFAAACLQS